MGFNGYDVNVFIFSSKFSSYIQFLGMTTARLASNYFLHKLLFAFPDSYLFRVTQGKVSFIHNQINA